MSFGEKLLYKAGDVYYRWKIKKMFGVSDPSEIDWSKYGPSSIPQPPAPEDIGGEWEKSSCSETHAEEGQRDT